jgi:hypothetical protein
VLSRVPSSSTRICSQQAAASAGTSTPEKAVVEDKASESIPDIAYSKAMDMLVTGRLTSLEAGVDKWMRENEMNPRLAEIQRLGKNELHERFKSLPAEDKERVYDHPHEV